MRTMSHNLNSLKGLGNGLNGGRYRVIEGDTRSLDYSSYSGRNDSCNSCWTLGTP